MFDYQKLINRVHDNFKERLSLLEVRELLKVDFDYSKDSPTSTGNALRLKRLVVTGEKDNGDTIFYDKKLYQGINVWIADNFSGKSSMFKIIKLALTGKNSIKKDVYSWLNQIFLEFDIGNCIYCAFLDLSTGKVKGGLHRLNYENLKARMDKGEFVDEIDIVFNFKGLSELETEMEDFFFHQLSYYSLKWTQRSSNKEDIGLKEAKTSWKTYFKTIYLESADYNTLFLNENFGGQEKKILEMILGLELTYPINRLSIKKDLLKNELGKCNLLLKSHNTLDEQEDKRYLLSKNLSEIDSQIASLAQQEFNAKESIIKYNELSRLLVLNTNKNNEYLKQREELQKEIRRTKKALINIKEHLEFGIYFTGLDIKVCPHCNNSVNVERDQEKTHGTCVLCNKSVDKPIEDASSYEQKTDELNQELRNLEAALFEINQAITKVEETIAIANEELIESESLLNQKRDINSTYFGELEKLLVNKGRLTYQIDDLCDTELSYSHNLQTEIDVLEFAIKYLEEVRFVNSKKIFSRFNEVMVKQLQAFGLSSIQEVLFDKTLNITLLQNGIRNKFSELNEGEQLRVKIAFYLALIQMDIEHKIGRHPRFLIIDSPGKEEVGQRDLTGLSNVFYNIEETIGDKLQIFIGTALREFVKSSIPTKVVSRKANEYIF